MKIVGLAAEYNPFHSGHLYHINRAKELTGADHVIVVMSGDFVQRGAPAVMPKHLRAKAALLAGASAVIELPVCFALGSAEYFAEGAVTLLDLLGCVDAICFGSECGDEAKLEPVARVLTDEPEEYREALRSLLSSGVSYPLARQQALTSCLSTQFPDEALSDILPFPNNILGIEYIKALRKRKSRIRPCTVKRAGSGYHEQSLRGDFCSASAIREALDCAPSDSLLGCMPPYSLQILREAYGVCCPVRSDDFSALLKYRLMTETAETLREYLDVSEDLANRIANRRGELIRISQFSDLLKTKEVTRSRISRCLFHILLGIRSADVSRFRSEESFWYARLLGFRKDCAELLSVLKKNSSVPLLTKLPPKDRLGRPGGEMLGRDIFAADLYESVVTDRFGRPFIDEYRKQVVRIPR